MSQLLFVLLVATLLRNQTTSKPFQPGNDYINEIFPEEDLQPSQVDNGTLVVRSKRWKNTCVKNTNYDQLSGLIIVECENRLSSWSCLSSIARGNNAGCNPKYEYEIVQVGPEKGQRKIIITDCLCA